MKLFIWGLAAGLAVSLAATSASARERSYWMRCDGKAKPESLGVTSTKIGAAVLTGGLSALAEEPSTGSDPGAAGIEACTQALADPALNPFWARKMNILWQRATLYAQAGEEALALADLKSAQEMSGTVPEARAYSRTFTSASQIFMASLAAKAGRTEEAERLATEAADARPYSMKVQQLAAMILALDPVYSPQEDVIATRRAAMDPDRLIDRAMGREWSDPQAAADDWAAIAASVRSLPPRVYIAEVYEYAPGSAERLPPMLAKAAFAAARAGRLDQAREMLAELETLKPWAPEKPPRGRVAISQTEGVIRRSTKALEEAAAYKPLIQAWILLHEGKPVDAEALIESKMVNLEPGALDLLEQIALKKGQDGAGARKAREQFTAAVKRSRMARFDVARVSRTITVDRAPKKAMPFSAASPLTFTAKRGYSDKKLETGEWRISFEAFYGTAVIEEMALLRAAQLARINGAEGFIVTDRRDFAKYYVSAYEAFTPPPTSYDTVAARTVSEVVFVKAGQPVAPAFASRKAFVLDAAKVWEDLAPTYAAEPEG